MRAVQTRRRFTPDRSRGPGETSQVGGNKPSFRLRFVAHLTSTNRRPLPVRSVFHVGFVVSDLDSSLRFYCDGLGLVLRHRQLQQTRTRQASSATRSGPRDCPVEVEDVEPPPSGHVLELICYGDHRVGGPIGAEHDRRGPSGVRRRRHPRDRPSDYGPSGRSSSTNPFESPKGSIPAVGQSTFTILTESRLELLQPTGTGRSSVGKGRKARLSGASAIVTGAGQGIGAAIARDLPGAVHT